MIWKQINPVTNRTETWRNTDGCYYRKHGRRTARQDRRPMMECKKALTEADGDMAKGRGAAARQAGHQGRQGRPRASRPKAWWPASISGNLGADRSQQRNRLRVQERQLHRHGQCRRQLVAEHNPANIEALGQLAYEQDGFGPTLEDVRKGPDRQDRREHVLPPLQALCRQQPGPLPARLAHWRGGRV